jgi:hypothetical protein
MKNASLKNARKMQKNEKCIKKNENEKFKKMKNASL